MGPSTFRCYVVDREPGASESSVQAVWTERSLSDLPAGDLLVEVSCSSLNYKDALAATGHPGIAPNLPHVPGIDAVGVVRESTDESFPVGSQVFINGHEFGSTQWGGWSEYCRIPASWAIPQPAGLTPMETITHGTAGFTAAQCVQALRHAGVRPEQGPVVVSGASGGVGCLTVAILAKLGFEVTAVSGKSECREWLEMLGASEVAGRELLQDDSDRPMLKRRWAGGIDTVGGTPLSTMLRQLQHGGCVAACGLAASPQLEMTVYPFILRGVTLAGIDSAWVPPDVRARMWELLAGEFRVEKLELVRQEWAVSDIETQVEAMLAGRVAGRTVVKIS